MSSMMETLQIRKQVSLLISQRPTSSATISLKVSSDPFFTLTQSLKQNKGNIRWIPISFCFRRTSKKLVRMESFMDPFQEARSIGSSHN
ncbi:LOW QUALITY PROTEIN: hypothetical protein YC2023_032821 [Brassica napus]